MKNRNKDIYTPIPEGCNRESQPYEKEIETLDKDTRGWVMTEIPESYGRKLWGWLNKIGSMLKQVQHGHNVITAKAFTLIELLVVVLIIGILAAIAVPQYQKAVLKSNISNDLNLLSQVLLSMQRYYMANSIYPLSFNELDINIPCNSISNAGGGSTCTYGRKNLKLYNQIGAYVKYPGNYKLEYTFGLNQGITCWAVKDNQTAVDVCYSYGGKSWQNTNQPGYESLYYTLLKR